jgi:DNA-binding response OmpR family regulator
MKVLIAEDDLGTTYALTRLLSGWGFEVQSVAHAADARAVLDGPAAPAMAVLEEELAGGSGIELCRYLRAPGRLGYTYVLMIGAIGDPALIQEVVAAGANDFLSKPFEIGELRRRMMAGRRLIDAVAGGAPVPHIDPTERLLRLRGSLEMAVAGGGLHGRRTLQPRIAGRRRRSV